jgi:hypothetical protein
MLNINVRIIVNQEELSDIYSHLSGEIGRYPNVRLRVPYNEDGGLQTGDPVIVAAIAGGVGLASAVLIETLKAHFQKKDKQNKSTRIVLTVNHGWLVKEIEGTDPLKVIEALRALEKELEGTSTTSIEMEIGTMEAEINDSGVSSKSEL